MAEKTEHQTNKLDVKIRYNTGYPAESRYKWRMIVDDVEHLVDSVEINCKSFTSQDIVVVDGVKVSKCHITCKAKNVIFSNKQLKKAEVL
jgi:hypothetical protein